MPMAEVNYLAVLTAGIAAFVLGALWYSPLLFGRLWIRVNGYSDDDLETLKQGMGRAYGVSLVCYLVMAAVLAMLFSYGGFLGVSDGVWLGFLCWLGFAATVGLTGNLFSDKPLSAWLIDAGYQLVYLAAMGAIIGIWQV